MTTIIKAAFLIVLAVGFCADGYSQEALKDYEVLPPAIMAKRYSSLVNRKPISLSSPNTKVTIVAMWALWCGPCRFVALELTKVHKEFANAEVKVIALSLEDPKLTTTRMRKFARRSRIRYELGWVDADTAGLLGGGKQVIIPQVLVISADGRLLKRFEGWDPLHRSSPWRNAIKDALQSP